MFTVKMKVQNSTILTQQEKVIIGLKGSVQYNDAIRMIDDDWPKEPVDFILSKPDSFADEECKEVLCEGYDISVHRADGVAEDPIAVIIDIDREFDDTSVTSGECRYQFLYQGDELYVMNDRGQTIEAVK